MGQGLRAAALALGVCLAAAAQAGDWPEFRHDVFGTSDPQETFTDDQARSLTVKWKANVPGTIANPVVVGGRVFVVPGDGSLKALDAATGQVLWSKTMVAYGPFHCFPDSTSQSVKGPVGAPEVVGDTVYMAGGDGVVYALDAASGAVEWQTPVADVAGAGEFLWGSITVAEGRVFTGISSLHDCLLVPGRVVALDQATGDLFGNWWADPGHGSGGGVWTTPAYDARTHELFLTTGTIAEGKTSEQQPLADAFVAVDPFTLGTLDHYSPVTADYVTDWDFGASPVLYDTPDGRHWIAATNKNGVVYALDRDDLAAGPQWSFQISDQGASPDEGESAIASPAYAHGLVFVGGARTVDGYAGAIAALDAETGQPRWLLHPPNGGFVLGAPAVAGDTVIFSATMKLGQSGSTLYVADQQTGEILFSMETPGPQFSQPTFSNGVLYFGDLMTGIWALAPTVAAPPDAGTPDAGAPDAGTPDAGSGQVLAADTFDRTGPMGPNWIVPSGAFSTDGTSARGTVAPSDAFWATPFDRDASVSISLSVPVGDTYLGVSARALPQSPLDDAYAAYVDPDGFVGLLRNRGGALTFLGTGPQLSPGTHQLSLAALGQSPVQLSVSVDGKPVLQASDSSPDALTGAGLAGIFDFNGLGTPIDDFRVVGSKSGGDADGGTDAGTPAAGTPDAGTGAIFSDDFNRVGALGPSWQVIGNFTADGTVARGSLAPSLAFWSGSAPADVEVEARVSPPNGSTYLGLIARALPSSPDADQYLAYVAPDRSIGIARENGGAYTVLASGPMLSSGTHLLALTVAGADPVSLSLAVDGTEVVHAIDSAPDAFAAAGLVGIADFSGASQPIDDFAVRRASVPPPPSPATTVVSDDFATPGALGSGWTTWAGGFSVQGGAAVATAAPSFATLGPAVSGDVSVSASVDPAGNDAVGLLARANPNDATSEHYVAWLNADGSVHLGRENASQYTALADAYPGFVGAHRLTLQLRGTAPIRISLYVDGQLAVVASDGSAQALTGSGTAGIVSWEAAGPSFGDFVETQP